MEPLKDGVSPPQGVSGNDPSGCLKSVYVTGFFDGMELGNKFSYWEIMDKNKKAPALNEVGSSFNHYMEKYMNDVTNIQLADGLDMFYSDYRNRSIMVDSAVWLVLNEIAGTPDAGVLLGAGEKCSPLFRQKFGLSKVDRCPEFVNQNSSFSALDLKQGWGGRGRGGV